MTLLDGEPIARKKMIILANQVAVRLQIRMSAALQNMLEKIAVKTGNDSERGDVPGWVLVVLMTTGLVTAIWTIAAPRLTAILRNSLDSMNGIR